jgi:hypothetical protein
VQSHSTIRKTLFAGKKFPLPDPSTLDLALEVIEGGKHGVKAATTSSNPKQPRRISMKSQNELNTINHHRQPVRLAVFATLLLVVVASLATFGAAADGKTKAPISVAQLAGPWQISLVGNTGCGISTLLFTGTFNSGGVASGTLTGNSGCGPSSGTQTLTITSLNSNGSGTAGLSCGSDCGWTFNIQVSPNKQVFNLVDVTDPGNYLAGSAVKQ